MGRVTLINIIGREDVEEKRESAPTCSGRSPEGIEWERKLNRFGRRRASRSRGAFCKSVAAGFLLLALVDFDGTFEVGAVFDHDARGGQVAVDRTIFLDFNSVFGAKVALHRAIHHHLA